MVLIVYIIPQNHYNDAAALLEAGKYDEAITAFTALDGYSDSAARITEAEYKKPATCSKTRNSQKPSKPSPPSAITKTAKIGSPRPSTAVP